MTATGVHTGSQSVTEAAKAFKRQHEKEVGRILEFFDDKTQTHIPEPVIEANAKRPVRVSAG